MVTWGKTFFQGHIARKMMVAVILFSSLITLLITGVQLWVDYRSGLAEIDATLLQIEKTHVPSLAVNVWTMNGRQIETKINGMSKLQDIELLEIINDNDKVEWAQETVTSTYFRETQYPLLFTSRGATDNLGTLRIVTSLDNLYYRLLEKTFFILGSNAVKTFIVAGFILFLFQRLVARHLVALSLYTRRLKLDAPIEDFQLNRLQDKHNPDELDQVVYSLNTMQLKLQDSYRQLATINKEL